MNYNFYIGITAAVLTSTAFLPQVLKVRRTRHTKDLSIVMYVTFTIGVALWTIYGVILGEWPIILANSFTLLLSGYLLYLKTKFG
ncbi:MAG: hypothetical protein COV46_01840 [Deltaproteobacteria bacterium CG11_big_fil_rev_8_21_14_0_20_49_13]|nr:MAG: hypothetical protein COV46_01840 [Deltaproteobacteria bacterium CG11_big_fil_rev_8_21_14_0_20_49_13]